MNGIELHHVTRQHAGIDAPAVDDVSLTVARGELVSLLGPSGCGKTTVLRMVAGIDSPDRGRILIDGVDVTSLPPAQRSVSLVFQNYALFPHLSVLDNVAYGLRASGSDQVSARADALDTLSLLGMESQAQRSTVELSGGQQQRVALARALALKPSVLLFDEPLSNLDEALRRSVREEIRSLQQRLRFSVLYVTHDQSEAMAVSDRIAVMDRGRVVQAGTPRQLYENPATPFVAGFMGETRSFEAIVGDDGLVRLGPLVLDAIAPVAAGRVSVLVRPEAWSLAPASSPGLAARVLRSAYLGRRVEYTVATELGEVLVVASGARRLREIGSPVSLQLGRAGVSLLAQPLTATEASQAA